MSRKGVAILEKPVETTAPKRTCCHHWIIEPALGPTSEGRCKLCGEKRIFFNIVEDSTPKSNLAKLFEPEESEDASGEDDEADD